MRDGTPPRSRDPRRSDPSASNRAPIPHRSGPAWGDGYPGASSRMPTLASTLYGSALGRQDEVWTSARLEAVQAHRHHLGIAIFHDGNPGHLWRGQVTSRFGEVLIGVSVVMWLATDFQSPVAVGLAVASLGFPFLVLGPMGAAFENTNHPGTLLKWLNYLRIVMVLGLVGLSFHPIALAIYPLLFLFSLFGRLHDAVCTSAVRTCLAPGEPEHVANDVYIGDAIAAVLGPIIVTLFFVLAGQRILVVAAIALIAFVVSSNSGGLLDILPPGRRAFLLATPETLYPDGYIPTLSHTVDDNDLDPEQWREESLPAWYQQGPTSLWQALGELRAGFGLAGSSIKAQLGLWGLAALGLTGGAFSALAVFYIADELNLPSFYLGPFMASEATGLILGSLALSSEGGRQWKARLWLGLVGSGALLAALSVVPVLLPGLIIALALGFLTALAVSGARRALYLDFDPVEQRSITAAETWVAAFGSVLGALLVIVFLNGTAPISGAPHLPQSLPGWDSRQFLILLGLALMVAAFVLAALSTVAKNRAAAARSASWDEWREMTGKAGSLGDTGGWDAMGGDGWEEGGTDYGASAVYQYDEPGSQTGYGPRPRGSRLGTSENYDSPDDGDPRQSSNRRRPPPRW
jgi:hypothetical protein